MTRFPGSFGVPVWLAALAALSCDKDVTSPAAAVAQDACASEPVITPTVTTGAHVVFDWAPNCGVALLLIEEGAADRWVTFTPDSTWDTPRAANTIVPPVTYGIAPSSASTLEPPVPLVAGKTYELILWRIIPEPSTAQCARRYGNACLVALKEFTP